MSEAAAAPAGVAALDRALGILAAFRPGDEQLSLAELAKRTGFYKSTILRLIATLERHRYVVRLAGGGYRLGPAVLHLGMVYQGAFRLEEHVVPVMRAVSKRTQETVSFFTHEGDTRVCLFRLDSPLSVRENHTRIGDLAPATRGPVGRVFAAFRVGIAGADPAAVANLPHVDVGGVFPDVASVVAPVFGFDGRLAGLLMVSGPKARFTRTALRRIAAAVLDAAREITAQIGGDARIFAGAASPRARRGRSSPSPRTASE